jgi:membrane fusion protein (multidrug efflux system)
LSSIAHARLAALAVALSTGVALGACGEAKKPPAPPPPEVLVAPALRRNLTLYTEAVATLDGYVNADIRARVKGFLRTQGYKDGSSVKNGQLLFTIESADYTAAVAAASATLARARVAHAHAKVQLERDEGLLKTGNISQQDVDNMAATLGDADGQVLAAQAQLDQTQLNLSYTQVHSPIDGVAGIALVRVGNLVGQEGPTLLTTVSQLDPVRVNFPMAEADYTKHFDLFDHLDQRDLAWAKKQFVKLDEADRKADAAGGSDDQGVALVLSDGSVYPHRGVIVSVNRQIDPSTGTIQVQALVPNPEGILRPGGYGSVRIKRRDAGQGVLAVPEKALISVQGTFSLGVVGPDDKVALRRVEVGPSVNGLRVIQKGIEEGDRVVVEGVQKISDGARVDAKPAPPPGAPSASPSGAASAPAPAPSGSAARN